MTRMEIGGACCGFGAVVTAESDAEGRVRLGVESECAAVCKMVEQIGSVDPYMEGGTFFSSSVYKAADACLRHIDCLVPAAVARLVNVEAGLALAHEISLRINKE